MGENIENMINVLETDIEILKDKIKHNELKGEIRNIGKMKDKDEKKRIIYILDCLRKNAEHYIRKIEELEDMEIDKILIENAEKINKITKLVPKDLKAGEKFETICPNCGSKLSILRESLNGHLWIVCEKEGVLFCE